MTPLPGFWRTMVTAANNRGFSGKKTCKTVKQRLVKGFQPAMIAKIQYKYGKYRRGTLAFH